MELKARWKKIEPHKWILTFRSGLVIAEINRYSKTDYNSYVKSEGAWDDIDMVDTLKEAKKLILKELSF